MPKTVPGLESGIIWDMQLPVTFPASRARMLRLLAISAAFVAIGFWARDKNPLMMTACIVFFGLGVIVALINLHPRASYLTLSESGFEFSSMFRRHQVAWTDVRQFGVISISGNEMVGWDYLPNHPRSPMARRVSAGLAGVEAALPDTFGHRAVELARLMSELHRKYSRANNAGS